jgi:hypothetical protein
MTDPTPNRPPLWELMLKAYNKGWLVAGRRTAYAAEISAIAEEYLLRFRDQWNPSHAATERWLLQQALIAEGKEDSEQFALLRALDHPEWQLPTRAEEGE